MWPFYSNTYNFILKLVQQNKYLFNFVFLFLDWFLVNLKVSKLHFVDSDKSSNSYSLEKNLFVSFYYYIIDFILLYFYKNLFSVGSSSLNQVVKIKQLNNNNFYTFNNPSESFNSFNQSMYFGLKSIWKHLRL